QILSSDPTPGERERNDGTYPPPNPESSPAVVGRLSLQKKFPLLQDKTVELEVVLVERYVAKNFVTEVEEPRGSTVRATYSTKAKLVETKLEMVRAAWLFHYHAAFSGVCRINSPDRLQRHEIDRCLQGGTGPRQHGSGGDRSSRFTYQGGISA